MIKWCVVTQEVMQPLILMHKHPKDSYVQYQACLSTFTNFHFLALRTPSGPAGWRESVHAVPT